MSDSGYKIRNQEEIYFCTFSVVYWIDIFTRPIYRNILIDSLRYCQQEKGLIVYAYVIMSNHVHLIIKSETGKLSDTIRDFKSFTSKQIIEAIKEYPESRRAWLLWMFKRAASKHKRNTEYQVWKHDNHPEELESTKFLYQKLNYIHQNPVRACIVQNPEDYLYSSAGAYAEIPGLLKITRIE
jgi:REP element-mobilizing transposase RayT